MLVFIEELPGFSEVSGAEVGFVQGAIDGIGVVDVGVVGAGHVRLRLESGDRSRLDAIAFRAAESPLGKALLGARGERLHVAGALTIDSWGGRERVQMRVLDAAPADAGP